MQNVWSDGFMKDFTKEELSKIFDFIEHNKKDSYDDMCFKAIQEKIQHMIANYDNSHFAKKRANHDYGEEND